MPDSVLHSSEEGGPNCPHSIYTVSGETKFYKFHRMVEYGRCYRISEAGKEDREVRMGICGSL